MPKATPTITTASLATPSRRHLVGGSILAALSGAAFGAAVVLPDPGEPGAVESLPSLASRKGIVSVDTLGPDAELLHLCAAIDALQVQADALYTGPGRIEDDNTRDNAMVPITDAQIPLIERICEMRPATLRGHVARARTYWGWDKDPPEADSPYCNEAMQGAILRDLAAAAAAVLA